jgi:hypothetical protein
MICQADTTHTQPASPQEKVAASPSNPVDSATRWGGGTLELPSVVARYSSAPDDLVLHGRTGHGWRTAVSSRYEMEKKKMMIMTMIRMMTTMAMMMMTQRTTWTRSSILRTT